jgi:hypothetical protein
MGGTKAAEKVIDAGVNGIDALFFTEEEKAEYNKKLQDLHLEMIKITANESTAQSISRRMICLPVVYSWLAMIFLNVGTSIAGHDFPAIGEAIEAMAYPALAAIGFYVGKHMIDSRGKK